MRRRTTPLILAAAVFVTAGGFVHLREWLDNYRDVPAAVAGSEVVRIGFLVNAGISFLLAAALLGTVFILRRTSPYLVAAALLFEAGSLAALIVSRVGSLLGWMEPVWTRGADQTRAVEIGALLVLAGIVAISGIERRRSVAAPAEADYR